MRAAEFIDQSLQVETAEKLFDLYRGAVKNFGFDRIIYSALRNVPGAHLGQTTPPPQAGQTTPPQASPPPSVIHSYPRDWIEYYTEQNYSENDPVRLMGLASRRAFLWDDMIANQNLSKAQMSIMNQGQDAGLVDGVGMAFHGPLGEAFGVGLASSTANAESGDHLTEIEVISTQFHVLYTAKFDQTPLPSVCLTPRELEVLKWVATGKSNWAIGEILNISEHGVDFHIRNILRKLDTDSRLTAVVKALHNGLLNL